MGLPEGWESDYDGTRWFFRYKATGTVQYHFPQPGDEYAEFLLDSGTGPIRLSPEERLVVEQHAKQQSVSDGDNGARNGPTSSGSKREKKVKDEFGMSATGYFDPMDFSGGFNDTSPLEEDDPEETVELPGNDQHIRSPVGFVAELATQETVKCAEELAPVELDGTSWSPAPIQTDIAQGPAELPTHQSPVDGKTPSPQPTQSATQLVDPSALTSASFSYSEVKPVASPNHGIPPRASSIRRKPVLSNPNSASLGQNGFQPWKPSQGIAEHPSQGQNGGAETLPQTSVLQNQNSELGIIGQNSSVHGPLVLGGVPNSLVPPSAPSKPASTVSSIINSEVSPVPSVLQPAHGPATQPVSPENISSSIIPTAQGLHGTIAVPVAGDALSYTPSVLKPGTQQANHSNGNLTETEGNLESGPPPSSNLQQSTLAHHKVQPISQISHNHFDQPNATGNRFDHGNHENEENPAKPPSEPDPSDAGRIGSQTNTLADEQIPVVAPLNFVKRHSSKSSQVSSIVAEAHDPTPQLGSSASVPSDEISEVISMFSSFTPQATPAPTATPFQHPPHVAHSGDNKPESALTGGGKVDQMVNGQSPPPVQNTNQPHGPIPPATFNMPKPAPTNAVSGIPPPSNSVNGSVQGGPKIQGTHYPPPPVSGPFAQNPNSLPPSPPYTGKPFIAPTPPGPLASQGNLSKPPTPQMSATPLPSPPPSQAGNIPPTHQPPVLGPQSNHANNAIQRPPQALQHTGVNTNVPSQGSTTMSPLHMANQHHGPLGSINNSMMGQSPVGQSQMATHNPTLHQQPGNRPPVGHQLPGSVTAQNAPQPTYQQPSPVTQTVSPIQSQVSSPAQSIASLHVSQSSTPSSAFATVNNTTNSHNGPIVNFNHAATMPARPSSMSAQPPTQQVGNTMSPVNTHHGPVSASVKPTAQQIPTANPPAKPYPMLPGQVTPLPSQVGSAPVPPPPQQAVPNNQVKPPFGTQPSMVGQPQAHMSGSPAGQVITPSQTNVMQNLPPGHVPSGLISPQAQMKPPQQQIPLSNPGASHTGGHQAFPSNLPPLPPQLASYPSTVAPGQTYNPQALVPPPPASAPVGGQSAFQPPPVASVISPQGKPSNPSQAGAAFSDAGKALWKKGKKMFQSPAIKQTAVAIGGGILAESVGVNAAAGAQLANNVYTNVTRPPLAHAQTAPAGSATQHQPVPMGQQPPGKLQPQPVQHHQHPLQPQQGQVGQPRPPQPGHLNQPQLGYPLPPPPPGPPPQPGQIKPTLPGHPQPGHPHVGQPQLGNTQPLQHPAGAQIPGRPPFVQVQSPALQAGIAVNLNAQAQAQANFYRPQYPPMHPAMAGGIRPTTGPPGPPGAPTNEQPIIDPMTANAMATIVGSAIGSAFRPDHSQPQNAHTSPQGHAPQEYSSHPGQDTAEHGAGAHEQAYHSAAPAQTSAAYADNNYMADTSYTDNSSYAANNTYVDNTDVVNNTIVIDNSTTVLADTTYNDASYTDMSSFNNTDITASTAIGIDMNSTVYVDSNMAAYGMDESLTVAATSEVSVDYSGDSWGDWFS
ncbi:hypothetical protein NPX13_g4577 [Xylaria arbuscula]|uniref:WW domain-containing protein n=1 Tax=Xylaria arbuscula TaxID=114810 RepID=A0A9W8NG33_9PEZI|nr:hypothetical protein NPX13_g4577 [Xylaria arbuscula]